MTTFLPNNLSSLTLATAGFDDLLLTGETVDDAGNTFTIMAVAEEFTFDQPVPIDVAVQRWMTDGAVASTQGHENREPYFKVLVSADNSAQLAAGEAALAKRAGLPGLLTWTPPEGDPDAPSTVFEVWTWHLEPAFDDMDERRVQRIYGVRCTAKPWVRSVGRTDVAALVTVASPTITEIDDCSSLTGWTGSPHPPTVAAGTAIEEAVFAAAKATSRVALSLTRTGSVTGLGSLPYLLLNITYGGGDLSYLDVSIDGTSLTKAGQISTATYWNIPPGVTSFSTLKVSARVDITHSGTAKLRVYDVSTSDSIGGIGSHMQLQRSLPVGGSVKTSGSIQIASPDTTPLGDVIVYTCPDDGGGYSPPMRQFRISGNGTTPDVGAASGYHESLVSSGASSGMITYSIPATAIREGVYALVGRFNSNTAGVTMTVTVQYGVSTFAGGQITGAVDSWVSPSTWVIASLGSLALPYQSLPAESGLPTYIYVTATATGSANITLDELYLFDITRGALTMVTADASTVPTQLWIDAPDADPVRNRPALYSGTQDDRSDAYSVPDDLVRCMGDHDLDPAGVTLLTVTTGTPDALASASFYHRWHTNAGD